MEASSRVQAFFAGFGFSGEVAAELARRFSAGPDGEADVALRAAKEAVVAWLATACPWVAESSTGLPAARAAFVRAGLASVSAKTFLVGEVPAEVVSALTNRPLPLPAIVAAPMAPQDVRMLPIVDDVLRSVLPLAPRRSS